MADQTQPNSSSGDRSSASDQTSGDRSGADSRQDQTQRSDPDRAAEAARLAAQDTSKPQRPAWASDDLWDNEKGLREDELKARLTEAQTLKADAEKRKTEIPEDPKAYKPELPEDVLKALPKDREINPDDPMWDQFRAAAKEAGLTQEQFKRLAGFKVRADLAAEAETKTAIERHQQAIHKALGDRGAELTEATRTWIKGFFKHGEELQHALFTPGIIKDFAELQQVLTAQGVPAFTPAGRNEGRSDGKPEGFENWSALDRRTWALQNQPGGSPARN